MASGRGGGQKRCHRPYSLHGRADCPALHACESHTCLYSETFLPLRQACGFRQDSGGRRGLPGGRVRTGVVGAHPCGPQDSTKRFFLNSLFICLAKQVMGTENSNWLKSSGHERPLLLRNERPRGYRVHLWVMTTFQNKGSISYVTM